MSLNPSGKGSITILVLGDGGVGKTSLISSLVSESWSERLPPVLQPVMVPSTLLPEQIQLTIIDTSSDTAHRNEWIGHLRAPPTGAAGAAANVAAGPSSSKSSLLADAVLLVVAADVPDSFSRVESHWLPLLEEHAARSHTPRRPVLIAINKAAPDGSDDAGASSGSNGLANSMSSLDGSASFAPVRGVASFEHLVSGHRVSCVLPCSAKYLNNLPRLFHACNTVILAPVEPLFELPHASGASASPQQYPGGGVSGAGAMRFKLLTQKALLRIFRLFDRDGDGVLSFPELDRLHRVNFKGKHLVAAAFDQLMARLAATNRDFVRPVGGGGSGGNGSAGDLSFAPVGLSFSGLLHFHTLFIEKHHHAWHTWTLVHAFGYQLGQVNPAAAAAAAAATAGSSAAAATAAASGAAGASASGSALPSLVRGSSQAVNAGSAGGAASGGAGASPSIPLPSLGSLVLSEHYCRLSASSDSFSPALQYELSPVAVEFLTELFRKYASAPEGMLVIKASAPASAAQSTAASPNVVVDAAPSTTCSLAASSDLERMFLASPDQPFGAAFARFVVRNSAMTAAAQQGQQVIGLEGWLSAWALLLYNYSTKPLDALTPSSVPAAPGSNLSASFTAPSSSSASFVPNPDIVLRYLAYLCFPVAPAVPEWSDNGAGGRVYLPRIQRCIHVTARQRNAREQAQALNEQILSTDPSMSSSAIRAQVSDSAAQQPRTVVCFVLGSAGCGRTAFIDCMLNNPPADVSVLSQPVSSAALAGQHDGGQGDAAAASGAPAAAAQARTFAARLPLQHVPASVAAASGDSSASSGVIDASLRSVPNRFLLLKDVPPALGGSLLSSSSFTPSSSDLVLVLYDASSVSSLEYALARVQQCFERRLPVMVVQTKADLPSASNPRGDFAQADYSVHVEQFSARAFWSEIARARTGAAAASALAPTVHIFERVYHAARHRQQHVLTSLSAAKRAQKRTRFVFLSLLGVASGVGLWMLVRSGALLQWTSGAKSAPALGDASPAAVAARSPAARPALANA